MNSLCLNEKSLLYHLKQYKMKKRLTYLQETASTNDVAKKLSHENKGRGALVAADCQTAGKGRLGRSFSSPKGMGIYFSAVYELNGNEKNLEILSSVAGLAVRDTLYNMFNIDAKIKWPNDILIDGKKVCGILCEIVNFNNRPKFAVIGIGVNIEKRDFEGELQYTATSVGDYYDGELDHNEILIDIVNNLDRYIIRNSALTGADVRNIILRLKAHSATLEKMIRVTTPDGEYDARALDIDEKGGLIVKSAVDIRTLTSGEVVHIR